MTNICQSLDDGTERHDRVLNLESAHRARETVVMNRSWDLYDEWMTSLRARECSRATLAAYRWAATSFLWYCDDHHVELADVTHGHIVAWLATRPVGPRSRSAYTSILATFFAWLEREEHLPTNPVTRVERPRLPKYLPRPAATASIHAVLDRCDARVGAMIACGAYAGMRRAEIAKLRGEDLFLHRDPPVVLVHGKGNKERLVPLHPDLVAALERHGIAKLGPIFASPNGGSLSPGYVGRLITGAFANLEHVVPHQLRHWCGSESYRASHDLRVVQEILGHESPATTAIYTKLDQERAGEVIGALPVRPLRVAPPAA